MAEGMDVDASRYQRTTIYGIIRGGSSLEISDCQKGPRGATERDLTTLMMVQRDYRRFRRRNWEYSDRKMFTRPLPFPLFWFRAARLIKQIYSDPVARRSHHPCQSPSSFVILNILIIYSHWDHLERSRFTLYWNRVCLITVSTIITYQVIYSKIYIIKNVDFYI